MPCVFPKNEKKLILGNGDGTGDAAAVDRDIAVENPGYNWYVGNKNFGESNGIIYAKRSTEGYFQQKVKMPEGLMKQNLEESEKYGDHYINLMSLVSDENVMVRVFTDDNKFISQDCRHLTRAGAQYFSRILDIEAILQK